MLWCPLEGGRSSTVLPPGSAPLCLSPGLRCSLILALTLNGHRSPAALVAGAQNLSQPPVS